MRPKLSPVFLAAFLAAMTLACGGNDNNNDGGISGFYGGGSATPETSGAAAALPSGSQGGNDPATLSNLPAVVDKVKPAVVQITSEQIQLNQFNQPFSVPAGVGSGVIYDKDGHILTNNHVVEGAQRLEVSLVDGRSMEAKVIGKDAQSDLAVIQISGDNLPIAQLGDSSTLRVGDWVIAIGNALGLPGGPTVTVGVASALGRSVQEPGEGNTAGPILFDLIQTSAPINPGNSGGPLINLAGQVIGINTLVAGQAEPGVPAQGIGFALSINRVKPAAEQLVANGQVQHAYLGVGYAPLNPAIAAQLGLTQTSGAAVTSVVPGSPAAQAGLRAGDVITQVEGKDLKGESDLAAALADKKPGDKVKLTVVRNGSPQTIEVTLGQAPG